MSKIFTTSENNPTYSQLPGGGATPPPALKVLDLPEGKYLVTAKINLIQSSGPVSNGFPYFAHVRCSLSTGSDLFSSLTGGSDWLDTTDISSTQPTSPITYVGAASGVVLTSALQLAAPGRAEIRCFGGYFTWNSLKITAVQVNEVDVQ